METKEWTLMFYFASDNPLASTIVSQLKALKDAGFHPDANVIAHFDPHVVNTPVHVFDVNTVNKFWAMGKSEVGFNDPFVRDLVLDRLWDDQNEDIRKLVVKHVQEHVEEKINPKMVFDPPRPTAAMSGEQDPSEALWSFLNFCHESYPARHYMLFIVGHGQVVGNDSLLYDDHAARHSLLLTELGEILRRFKCHVSGDEPAGKVELIGLHSCSMSAMEVAYEFRGAANYLLAAQGPLYVGNLPYRQILMRVFNDLDDNSNLTPDDINGFHEGGKDGKQIFVEKLFEVNDGISKYVRSYLANGTKKDLNYYKPGSPPEPNLVVEIVKDLNNLLDSDAMSKTEVFEKVSSSKTTNLLPEGQLSDAQRRKYHRSLLCDAYPEIARYPRPKLDIMLTDIFYDCLYNSYDFQLAGYSFDLCLLNLTKVSESENPINNLAKSLIAGLNDKNPSPKQLILLAHWDAQSFYNEDYVDLYDFCFCLMRRCDERKADLIALPSLQGIYKACAEMRSALEKGPGRMITLAAFAGAAFQYSNGVSIYFPWSKPIESKMWDDEYAGYRLNRKTKWREFLNVYFEKTMRQTRAKELEAEGGKKPVDDKNLSREILMLIEQIGAHVFTTDGSSLAQKPGPDHPMGKYGPDDPQGATYDCPSIKNHPHFTGKIPVSEDFFAGAARKR